MPRTFAEVYDLYRDAASKGAGIATQQNLADFAKDLNVWTGTQDFEQAVTNTPSRWAKQASYWADKGIEKTGVDKLAEEKVGNLMDNFGMKEFGQEIGRGMPRMMADMSPLLIPGAGWAGLVGAGVLGAGNAWEKSGSGKQAATGFVGPFAGAAASKVLSAGTSAALSKVASKLPFLEKIGLSGGTTIPTTMMTEAGPVQGTVKVLTGLPDKIVNYVAGNAGAGAGIDLLNRAVNGSPGYDFFSKENLAMNVVNSLPFALYDLTKFYKPVPIRGFEPNVSPEATEIKPTVVPDAMMLAKAQLDVNIANERQIAEGISDPVKREEMLKQIDQKHYEELIKIDPTLEKKVDAKVSEGGKAIVDTLVGKVPSVVTPTVKPVVEAAKPEVKVEPPAVNPPLPEATITGKPVSEIKSDLVKANPTEFEKLQTQLNEIKQEGVAWDKRMDAERKARAEKAAAEAAARRAAFEKLKSMPVVTTPEQAAEAIQTAKVLDVPVTDTKVEVEVKQEIAKGTPKEEAVVQVGQKAVNDAERKKPQVEKKEVKEEVKKTKFTAVEKRTMEANDAIADLMTKASDTERKMKSDPKTDPFYANVWNAVKPYFTDPENQGQPHSKGYPKKKNLATDVGIIYKNWEAARADGTVKFGEAPIAHLSPEEQIKILVGAMKVATTGERSFVIPTERALDDDGNILTFKTEEEAIAHAESLGPDWKAQKYTAFADGTHNYAVRNMKPGGVILTSADVEANVEVMQDLVNTAEQSNQENLGASERHAGEIAEEAIVEQVNDATDADVEALMQDKEVMQTILKNPDLKKTLDILRDNIGDDAEAMRALLESMLKRTGTKEALVESLAKLQAIKKKAIQTTIDPLEESQRKLLLEAQDAFLDQLSDFVESKGQKWTPAEYNHALHFTQVNSERNVAALEYFNNPEHASKAEVLTEFLNGQKPMELAAMFAGEKAQKLQSSRFYRARQMWGKRDYSKVSQTERNAIWRETGWTQFPDGKWRFEINDSPAYVTHQPSGSGLLPAWLKHAELYEKYPELRNVKVTIDPTLGKNAGVFYPGFDPVKGQFSVKTSHIEMAPNFDLHALLHEVQHAIQEIENFAAGSHSKDIALVHSLSSEARKAIKQSIIDNAPEIFGPDWQQKLPLTERAWDQAILHEGGDALYRLTHGEQESTLTEKRLQLTKREREFVTPFIDSSANGFTILPSVGTSFELAPQSAFRSKFERDAKMPSFVRAFGIALEKNGVDFNTAKRVAEEAKLGLLKVMGLDDVRFGRLINDNFGREVLGLAPVSGNFKRMWLDADSQMRGAKVVDQSRNLAIQIAHETGHMMDWMDSNNLLGEKAKAAKVEAEKWFENASQEDLKDVLNVMRESLLPKEWQELPAMKELMDYTADPKEALATAYGLWKLGAAAKDFDGRLMSAMSPKPVRNWFSQLTATARKILSSVKTAFLTDKGFENRGQRKTVDELIGKFEKLQQDMAQGQRDLDALQMITDLDASSFEGLRTSALDIVNNSRVSDGTKDIARLMVRDTWPKDVAVGVARQASRWLEFGEQMAKRIPKLGEAWWSVLQAPMRKSSYLHEVMAPITGEADPATGKFKASGTREKQLKLLEKESLRQLISDIERHQNRESRFLDKAQPKDQLLLQRLNGLGNDERNAVESYLGAKKVKNQIETQKIVEYADKTNTVLTAKVIAALAPDKHGVAMDAATKFMQAEDFRLNNLPQEAAQSLAEAMQMLGDPNVIGQAQKFMAQAVVGRNKLATFLKGRPWFSSEIQSGKYRVIGLDAQGNRVDVWPADNERSAALAEKEMRKNGAVKFDRQEIIRGNDFEIDDGFKTVLEGVESRMTLALKDATKGFNLAPDVLDKIVSDIGLMGHFYNYKNASKFTAPNTRVLSKQAEKLDMVATSKRYSQMMANSLVNRLSKHQLEFALLHPDTQAFPEETKQIQDGLNNYLKPDGEFGKMVVKMQAPYFLGLNLSSHLVELFQGVHTILPEAVREVGSVRKASSTFMGVLKDLGNYYALRPFRGKDSWDSWGNKDERRMLEQFGREGIMTRHAYEDGLDVEGESAVMSRYRATANKPVEFLKSVGKVYSDVTMGIYENFTRFNARSAALLGYRLARSRGLTHEQAVENARKFTVTTTFSSGRAGRPVAPYGGSDNSLGMTAMSLQRYSLSWMNMFARNLQHAFTSDPGRLGLSKADQLAAKKSAAMMALTQFASAGALGLPFVGAMSTILEKTLGVNLKGSVYEMFGQLLDQDNEEGGVMADIIMRGGANAMLDRVGVPIDLASKFAIGGTPGFSEMQGFDSGSIFGPTASMVKSIAMGVGSLAKDGSIKEFARQAAPPGLRKAIDLLANGDATTKEGSSYGLSEGEKGLYALGFTPDRVRKMRDFERYNDANNLKRRRDEARESADILGLLESGDHAGAMTKAQEIVLKSEGYRTLGDVAQKVAALKVKKDFPTDVRSEVAKAEAPGASQIMRAMGLNPGQSREAEKQSVKAQVLAAFGQRLEPVGTGLRRDLAVENDPWLASFASVR